jgi:hypothetical protein
VITPAVNPGSGHSRPRLEPGSIAPRLRLPGEQHPGRVAGSTGASGDRTEALSAAASPGLGYGGLSYARPAALTRLAELENALEWHTTCTSCARILDSAIAETFDREVAERQLGALAADVQAVLWQAATGGFVHVVDGTKPQLTEAYERVLAVISQVLDRRPLKAARPAGAPEVPGG